MGGAQVVGTSSSVSDKKVGGAASDSNFAEVPKIELMLSISTLARGMVNINFNCHHYVIANHCIVTLFVYIIFSYIKTNYCL